MSRNAVGFNPSSSMLSGLRGTPSYGKAMSAASELSLESQTANKKQNLEEKNQENQRQDKKAGIYAQNASQGMQRQAKHKQHQMKQGADIAQSGAGHLALSRNKHWDVKNSAIQGLLS